jgi:hypothetical protein
VKNGKSNGKERPADAILDLAAEIKRDDGEWDDWEELTVRTGIVEDRRHPSRPDGMVGVAHATVNKQTSCRRCS